MENLKEQIQELQKIIDTYDNIVFFRRCRCLHRKWDSGLPQRERSVPSAIRLSSGDHIESQLLPFPSGRIFPFYRNKMLFPKSSAKRRP